jgi:2,3,4,5-tetrahydropyridine-2-carboxylate N-succinyltransferase
MALRNDDRYRSSEDKIKLPMTTTELLADQIEHYFAQGPVAVGNHDAMTAFLELRAALEAGKLRAAEPDAVSPTGWRVNALVKRGILLGFRLGDISSAALCRG